MGLPVSLPGDLLLAAIALAALSGLPAVATPRGSRAGERLSAGLSVLSSLVGLAPALWLLLRGEPGASFASRELGTVAGTALSLRADALSAFFLVPLFLVSGLAAVYGLGYWPAAERPDSAARLRLSCGLLVAAMAVVVTAGSSLLLLVAWEVMALAAFLAATVDDADPAVREAGWVYLVATHTGTLALIALVAILRAATGTFAWTALAPGDAPLRSAVFLLAVVGFGFKAGLVPLHFWLPGAHANAPSHVSALLSGVMLNMGIYGVLRVTQLLPSPPAWWGWSLLVAGLLTAVTGILLAIRERDVKRLLAYSSVENMGIAFVGVGLAIAARSAGHAGLAALALAAAALHLLNHSLFKSLLFFAAGALIHAEGTRDLDAMGGLLRRLPRIGGAFAVGAVAVTGLPPLNGFAGEFLLYVGLLGTWSGAPTSFGTILAGVAVSGLALVGALAVAAFVKAFGVAFLGEPRAAGATREHASHADAAGPLAVPLAVLVPLCVLLGVFPLAAAPALERVASAWWPRTAGGMLVDQALARLSVALCAVAALLLLAFLLLALRLRKGAGEDAPVPVGTWDCGYAAPSSRMQYTAGSFSDWIAGGGGGGGRGDGRGGGVAPRFFAPVEESGSVRVEGLFPRGASFGEKTPDPFLEQLFRPAIGNWAARLERLRVLQQGKLPVYLLYVFATVLGLLAWSVLSGLIRR